MKLIDGTAFASKVREAAKFTRDRDQIIDVQRLVGEPGSVKTLAPVRRLADYSDLSFFSFGPVYTSCCVPFDIVEEFRTLCGYDGPRVTLQLQHEVISGIDAWSRVIEGIATEAVDDLNKFATSQSIVSHRLDAQKRAYWRVQKHDVLIADPLAVARGEFNGVQPKSVITIYAPSGSRVHIEPDILTMLPVQLQTLRPHRNILREAQAVFSTTLHST